MTRQIGVLQISHEMLMQMLSIPEGHRIVGVHDQSTSNLVAIQLSGPDMPVTEMTDPLPKVTLQFTKREPLIVNWGHNPEHKWRGFTFKS